MAACAAAWTWTAGTVVPPNARSRVAQASWTTVTSSPRSTAARVGSRELRT